MHPLDHRLHVLRLLAPFLLLCLLVPLLALGPTGEAVAARRDTASTEPTTPTAVEDYAGYEPQKTCSPKAKPGTRAMQAWAVKTFGGRAGGISRACRSGGASEHKEGRAFDWTLDARKAGDRAKAQKFLDALFAAGPAAEDGSAGQAHELARRMGVMYVIWNDKMYASYRKFEPKAYVSSSCRGKKLAKCSPTLRHRDHVHVSLSWAGGRAQTSWYATPEGRRFR